MDFPLLLHCCDFDGGKLCAGWTITRPTGTDAKYGFQTKEGELGRGLAPYVDRWRPHKPASK